MIGSFIILVLSVYPLFISYQAFRYRRLYWDWPTLAGYRRRKETVSPKLFAYFVGTISLIFGTFLLILSVRGLYNYFIR